MTCKYFYFYTLLFSIIHYSLSADRIEHVSWGDILICDPLIETLIETKAMQRIKDVEHLGPITKYRGTSPLSRYDHCIGVWALLKKAGCSQEEQAAGLLHDASHTAFSHLAEVLFKSPDGEHSYQDKIHLWFLQEMKIDNVIEKFAISLEQLNPDLPHYTALEQPLPALCADRIDYTLHVGRATNRLTQEEAQKITDDLFFNEGKWFFNSTKQAKKFAILALDLVENVYAAPENTALYHCFAQALHRAIELNLLTYDDLHFKSDSTALKKLEESNDQKIKDWLNKCATIENHFILVPYEKGDYNLKPKFRGIDPLVFNGQKYKLLTEIDADFAAQYNRVKKWCSIGYGVTIK